MDKDSYFKKKVGCIIMLPNFHSKEKKNIWTQSSIKSYVDAHVSVGQN